MKILIFFLSLVAAGLVSAAPFITTDPVTSAIAPIRLDYERNGVMVYDYPNSITDNGDGTYTVNLDAGAILNDEANQRIRVRWCSSTAVWVDRGCSGFGTWEVNGTDTGTYNLSPPFVPSGLRDIP